jgi:hypothetical protein
MRVKAYGEAAGPTAESPILSKQRVPSIEPGLNGLHQQEAGQGKKRDRAQQGYWQR